MDADQLAQMLLGQHSEVEPTEVENGQVLSWRCQCGATWSGPAKGDEWATHVLVAAIGWIERVVRKASAPQK